MTTRVRVVARARCTPVFVSPYCATPANAPLPQFPAPRACPVPPVVAAGLAGRRPRGRRTVPEAQPPRRPGLAVAGAYLADGYVLVAALFLIGWVTLFGAEFTRSGVGPSFAVDLI